MGCAASKQHEEENNVVFVCKERKRLMKLAVKRRYAFADSQCKYNHSLCVVASAIRLFVARHSSPTMPYLITFPPSPPSNSSEHSKEKVNTMFLKQTPTEPISCQPCNLTSSSEIKKETQLKKKKIQPEKAKGGEEKCEKMEKVDEEDGDDDDEVVCEHFYDEHDWDFFDSFDKSKIAAGVVANEFISKSCGQNVNIVRTEEGIPELDENAEKKENAKTESKSGEMGLEKIEVNAVKIGDDNEDDGGQVCLEEIDTPEKNEGKELLEALKEVEELFIRVYQAGMDVSKMLEVSKVHLLTGFEEIKESSNKLIRSITWNRMASSQSSSCKSIFSSSSKTSSAWMEMKTELFDDYGGMESGSHSSTLGRLYVWEKKLYQEVKAGEEFRKLFEKKCSVLRDKDARGDGIHALHNGDKTRVEVKDLHTRILVSIRSAETISERIKILRDEELHPQLVELLHGLTRISKIMSESHEAQNRIMIEVASFNCPYGKFCNDSHRLATLQLIEALQDWQTCFAEYVSMQKAYIEALDGWLSKFISPELESQSKNKNGILSPPRKTAIPNPPPLLVLCRDWLAGFDTLPNIAVTSAMKNLGKDVRALWAQQGEEQQQKRKVDRLSKEFDKRALAFRKTENKILGTKISTEEAEAEADIRSRMEYLAGRREFLDLFQKRVEMEREKHISSMDETQKISINGLQSGFSSVFESLVGFSNACFKMYGGLVTYIENGKEKEEKID